MRLRSRGARRLTEKSQAALNASPEMKNTAESMSSSEKDLSPSVTLRNSRNKGKRWSGLYFTMDEPLPSTELDSTDPIVELQECKELLSASLKREKRKSPKIATGKKDTPRKRFVSNSPQDRAPKKISSINIPSPVPKSLAISPDKVSQDLKFSEIEEFLDPTSNSLIQEEIQDLYNEFPRLSDKYRILRKIGEGTFSSVYKAVDNSKNSELLANLAKKKLPKTALVKEYKTSVETFCVVVALKRIYVTSSPRRIYNEISILHTLRGHPNIVSVLMSLRHEDQDYYLDLDIPQIKKYMTCLLSALEYIHKFGIMHRDVKPSNFLFNPETGRGILVDFGLAQKMDTIRRSENSVSEPLLDDKPVGILLNDKRPHIRANRAGSRGFRAPEVLFRVVNQTTAIDVWSSGVILLCIVSGHFPFFQSNDDTDALIEICTLFGYEEIEKLSAHLNRRLKLNIPTVTKEGIAFEEISKYFTSYKGIEFPVECYDILRKMLEPNPDERIKASDAVKHAFFF